MNISHWISIVAVVISSIAHGDSIRVMSFNIANFGDTKEYNRSLITLTNIIRSGKPDLICLQEVEPNALGHAQVYRLVSLLNLAANYYEEPNYLFEIPDFDTGDENVAFIYRHPITIADEFALLPHHPDPDGDGKPTFVRTPILGHFSVSDYNFTVVNCHLYTKLAGASGEGRDDELKALTDYLRKSNSDERVLLLGDFNRFLGGRDHWKIFYNGRNLGEDTDRHYRFPLLEAIKKSHEDFDPSKHDAPNDATSTTTSKSRRIYDQIVISSALGREFTTSPKLGKNIGIIAFDTADEFEWFGNNWHKVSAYLSDHRPIWIELPIPD